jgi:hypothetical protein
VPRHTSPAGSLYSSYLRVFVVCWLRRSSYLIIPFRPEEGMYPSFESPCVLRPASRWVAFSQRTEAHACPHYCQRVMTVQCILRTWTSFLDISCYFPQHFCDLGANFQRTWLPRPSGPKPHRTGSIANGCSLCECIYVPPTLRNVQLRRTPSRRGLQNFTSAPFDE